MKSRIFAAIAFVLATGAVIWCVIYSPTSDIPPLAQMFGTGLFAAAFTQAVIWWREHSREVERIGHERQFIALQVAVVLERYAIQCAMSINDIDQALEESYQSESHPHPIPGMPDLKLPEASEWRWIETSLSSEVLSLAPRISFAEGSIRFTLDVAGSHSGALESQAQLGLIGAATWQLATLVRQTHRIAPQSYTLGKWDFLDTLAKHRRLDAP